MPKIDTLNKLEISQEKSMTATYDKFAKFYDLEYGHKENDLDFYIELAKKYGGPILEIGVGTGRVAFELAAEGHQIHGVDNSAEMLKSAHEILDDYGEAVRPFVTLTQGDMRDFDLGSTFSMCIAPFRTLLHNLNLDDQISTLKAIKKHLQPGGIFAFDLFVPLYNVIAQEVWHDRLEPEELADPDVDISIDIEVKHQPENHLLTISNTYLHGDEKSETVEMKYRYIFRYEMETLLRRAGFSIIDVYGGFEQQPYDYSSGMMVFVAAA